MSRLWQARLRRCINGTYVSVEDAHLFRYVDEEAFRFNERKGKDRDRFIKAAGNMEGKRLTYKELIDRGDDLVGRRGRMPKLYEETTEENQP